MKKLSVFMFLLLSLNLFSFEELKGIGERKCGVATKKGVTHPQFPTYKMNCETFEHIIGSWYKDKENVYFYKDINSMYIGFEVIENINPEKVKPVGESMDIYYISDGENIYIQEGYYLNGIIENPDTKTFKVLNKYYAKDKNTVYFLGEKVQGADAKTFKVLTIDTSYGEDKNIGFEYGKMILPPPPID